MIRFDILKMLVVTGMVAVSLACLRIGLPIFYTLFDGNAGALRVFPAVMFSLPLIVFPLNTLAGLLFGYDIWADPIQRRIRKWLDGEQPPEPEATEPADLPGGRVEPLDSYIDNVDGA